MFVDEYSSELGGFTEELLREFRATEMPAIPVDPKMALAELVEGVEYI
jgi:hypothetical protein